MKTPVIIPAFNEASNISQTLNRLPEQLVEPIVVVNGEPDGTAEIARDFGVTVYEIDKQGKMPAIQHALGKISTKQALEPLIILDADARPLMPRQWHNRMVSIVHETPGPVGLGGPMIYSKCSPHEAALRSLRRMAYAGAQSRGLKTGRIQHGPSMALNIDTPEVLEAVMEIPNYWPGEDRAIADTIEENGGTYIQTINLGVLVVAPLSLSAVPMADRLKLGAGGTRKEVTRRYIDSGPSEAMPYVKLGL